MNRKTLMRVFALLLALVCLLALASCGEDTPDTPEPNPSEEVKTYTVTYDPANGSATFTYQVRDGQTTVEPASPERDGYVFRFWAVSGTETAFDFTTPVHDNLTLVAVWEEEILEPDTVRIRWDGDDEAADFLFDGVTPRLVKVGETVRFRLSVSPYFVGEPVVTAGSVTATRDGDVYSFVATESVTVRVSGLSRDDTPITGLGTEKSPYLITTPSQLKTVTDSINGGADKYRSAYIRLGADLDLRGITLDPIGGQTTYFEGVFDGAGHTVSNFRLNGGTGVVGFFGYIAEATVKNLTIATDLSVEASDTERNYIIGPVVAYAISGDIMNCTYRGTLRVRSSLTGSNVVYAGGICGFAQGYGSDYTGAVSYCRVEGTVSSDGTAAVTGLGGIAGMLLGTSDAGTAYVHNSVFNGTLSGASEKTGGIVGYLRERSSVANCYTAGTIDVRNGNGIAAAGALIGTAENETAVMSSASVMRISAVGASTEEQDVGDLVGITLAPASVSIDARRTVLKNAYFAKDGSVNVAGTVYDLTKRADLTSLLGWHAADWQGDGATIAPDVRGADTADFTVRFVFGTDVTRPGPDGTDLTQSEDPVRATGYVPIYWAYGGNGMNTFKADNGYISYGYFFDEARTERIPASMLLTGDMTVYVGFADYSGLVGEYYAVIEDHTVKDKRYEVKLTFDDNGKLEMYVEGMLANYVYVYDGQKILIRDGYFAYLAYSSYARKYDLDLDYYAIPTDGGLTITDTTFFTEKDNTKIAANKKTVAFGTWYTADGAVYRFLSDGTGSASDRGAFAYTCVGNTVRIRIGTEEIVATVSAEGDTMQSTDLSVSLLRYDAFEGTWESAFNLQRHLVIDGRGHLTLDGTAYTYTVEDGTLTFGTSSIAFNDSGLLVLTEGKKKTVFGREGSYIGTWIETARNYQVQFYGIGKDGYGTGLDTNGANFTYVVDVETDTAGNRVLVVTMYYRTQYYGSFSIAVSDDYGDVPAEVLFMMVFTPNTGAIVDDYNMCYYDPFMGAFHTTDGMTLEFNGFGAYKIDYHSSNVDWVAIGKVKVTKDGTTGEVEYVYNRKTGTATFTYGGVNYTAVLGDDGLLLNGETPAYAPDSMQEYPLQAADGSFILTFNGKSAAGLGVATMTLSDGTTVTYDYTMVRGAETDVVTLTKDGEDKFVLHISRGRVTVTPVGGDETECGLWHRLLGNRYLVGGGYAIVTPATLDATGYGTGKLGDLTVDFYYVDANYLSMYSDGEFLYYLYYLSDGTAALVDNSKNVIGIACREDGLAGTYRAANGDTLTLDGRSVAADHIYPSAELTTDTDTDDPVTEVLTYHKDGDTYCIYRIDRSGDEDRLILVYRISMTEVAGAVAYTSDAGVTLWLIPANA